MGLFDKLTKFGNTSLSVLQDPFARKHVTSIFVHYRKSLWGKDWSASGSVEFQNGDTKGEQKFKADTFDEVVKKMQAFVQTLEE